VFGRKPSFCLGAVIILVPSFYSSQPLMESLSPLVKGTVWGPFKGSASASISLSGWGPNPCLPHSPLRKGFFLWSSIGILQSTLSMTSSAPIDGVRVGVHPLVKKLVSGVFNVRPLAGLSRNFGVLCRSSTFFNTGLLLCPFPILFGKVSF
jgi:hypothetical protein